MTRAATRGLAGIGALVVACTATALGQVPASPSGAPASTSTPSPAMVERAAQVLAASRQALGGARLAGVRTVVATGQTRRVRGNNLVPIEFEISLELPDKYLRRDESPAEETDPTSSGFNGADLIQVPPPTQPAAGRPGGPAAPPSPEQVAAQRRARVASIKQDFVRFALGLFPDSFATYPLTFAYAATAEAPQGTADVLDVTGADNFRLRFFVNSDTRLPVMVSWTLPPTNVIVTAPGQPAPATVAPGAVVVSGPVPPGAAANDAEKAAYAKDVAALRQKAQATPVEHRIYFADYRDVGGGVLFPFRLRRAIGADTTEETTFDRFRINSRISAQKFVPLQ